MPSILFFNDAIHVDRLIFVASSANFLAILFLVNCSSHTSYIDTGEYALDMKVWIIDEASHCWIADEVSHCLDGNTVHYKVPVGAIVHNLDAPQVGDMLVVMPPTTYSPSARFSWSMASSRVLATPTSLEIIGS